MIKSKKNISRVLFDVRPVSSEGIFDFKKAEQIQETLDLRKHENNNRELPEIEYQPRQKTIEREEKIKSLEINPPENILPEIKKDIVNEPQNDDIQDLVEGLTKEEILAELNKIEALDSMLSHHPVNFVSNQEKKDIFLKSKETSFQIEQFYFPEAISYKEEKTAIEPKKKFNFEAEKLQKPILKFILTGFIISLIVPAFTFLSKGLEIKDQAIGSSLSAYQNLLRAKESLEKSDWQTAEKNFSIAHADFIKTQEEINQLGRLTVGILEKIPGTSLISSGSHLIKVGENFF